MACQSIGNTTIAYHDYHIGTGGAQIPVFREESGKFTLLGKEVLFTEKCPALGAKEI